MNYFSAIFVQFAHIVHQSVSFQADIHEIEFRILRNTSIHQSSFQCVNHWLFFIFGAENRLLRCFCSVFIILIFIHCCMIISGSLFHFNDISWKWETSPVFPGSEVLFKCSPGLGSLLIIPRVNLVNSEVQQIELCVTLTATGFQKMHYLYV